MLPNTSKLNIAAEKRVHGAAANTLIREAWVSFTLDGERHTGMYLVVITFDPELKLIEGERMYADTNFQKVMARDLGDDYGDFPGFPGSRTELRSSTSTTHSPKRPHVE